MSKPEVWLRGPVEGIAPLLQPVAHSLLQSREEMEAQLAVLTPDELWHQPSGAASAGFHARHAAASLDRLFTYARGQELSDAQWSVLKAETTPDPSLDAATLRAGFDAMVERALEQLRSTDAQKLTDVRHVGRARLPSTALGLLFHAAEHTQRHLGQIATVVKIVTRADGRAPL